MKQVLEFLKRRGLEVQYEESYDREESEAGSVIVKKAKETIYSIQIPLTDAEWCDLCMRDGEMYQGGCCDQTGQIQDVINEIFRDSGTVKGETAEALISVAASHDGYELLRGVTEKELLEVESTWEDLDPARKIVLCVAAAAPYMKIGLVVTASDLNDPHDVLAALNNAASYLRWKELFKKSDQDKQHKGNRAVRIARMIPAARAFLLQAQNTSDLPFKGFVVVNQKKEVIENMMGYAIFETRKEAENLLELWKQSERGKEDLKKVSINTVEISVEYGLRIGE